jgi:hypothetical protein
MELDIRSKNFLWPLLLVLALIRLMPLISTGFVSADDVESYMNALKNIYWGDAPNQAHFFGRFYFLFTQPLYTLPYITGNIQLTKIINIIFLLGCFITSSYILKVIFKSHWIGYLFFLLSITFVSFRSANNPVLSYPVYFSGSFLLILLSFYNALIYNESGKRIQYISSILLYVFGLLFYEIYFMYLPLLIFIIGLKPFREGKTFSDKIFRSLKNTYPYFIIGIAYLAAYFIYRIYYPGNYYGTTFTEKITLADSWLVIKNMARGGYPLYFFFNGQGMLRDQSLLLLGHKNNVLYVLQHAQIVWIVKGLIIAGLFALFIKELKLPKIRTTISLAIIFLLFIYIPNIPLSISDKYVSLMKCCGMNFYITTFFSFFAIIPLLIILITLYKYFKGKLLNMFFTVLFSIIIFISSILTDYVNQACINDMKIPATTFSFMDRYFKTEEFKSLPNNACIYAPNLYNFSSNISYVYGQTFKWTDYAFLKFHEGANFTKSKDELIASLTQENIDSYYMNYGYDRKAMNHFICYGKLSNQSKIDSINNLFVTDEATLFYYSTYKTFSVFVSCQASGNDTVWVNHTAIPLKAHGRIIRMKYKYPNATMNPVKIQGKNIILNYVSVTNIVDGKPIDVEIE